MKNLLSEDLPDVLTLRQVADDVLHIHINTARRLARTGRIPAVRLDTTYVVPKARLEAFLAGKCDADV
jgi:excisionase family DNA binding protein